MISLLFFLRICNNADKHFYELFKNYKRLITKIMKGTIWIVLLSIIVFAFSLQEVFAGNPSNELFSDLPYTADPYDKVDPTVVRDRYVQVNFEHLAGKNLSDGAESLVLNLFNSISFTAIKDRFEVRSTNQYTWFGRIEGMKHSQVILTVENGSMAGNITFPYGTYEVRNVGNGVHAIYEINQEAFPEEAPPALAPIMPDTPDMAPFSSEADDGSIIDVMVVYTDDVASASANIALEIQLAIDETNQSYANSGINQRLRLVHSAEVSYTETGNLSTDLNSITSKTDGCLDDIHTWRNTHAADAVSFWVENGGDYCGIAWLMSTVSSSFESYAFSVVARSCATGYYTFGHELGHNMSAHHDWYVNTDT
ncbi:zinc-dependent metalloprotease, partial [Candidatus Woesearchaeota archaeon]|nr:zinc-dependent metalloprotease [Candidatus Woesearchaeota archaeon]